MNDGKAEVTGTTGLNHDQEVKRRGGWKKGGQKREAMEGEVSWV